MKSLQENLWNICGIFNFWMVIALLISVALVGLQTVSLDVQYSAVEQDLRVTIDIHVFELNLHYLLLHV